MIETRELTPDEKRFLEMYSNLIKAHGLLCDMKSPDRRDSSRWDRDRYIAIAITDIEKILAFVKTYLTE